MRGVPGLCAEELTEVLDELRSAHLTDRSRSADACGEQVSGGGGAKGLGWKAGRGGGRARRGGGGDLVVALHSQLTYRLPGHLVVAGGDRERVIQVCTRVRTRGSRSVNPRAPCRGRQRGPAGRQHRVPGAPKKTALTALTATIVAKSLRRRAVDRRQGVALRKRREGASGSALGRTEVMDVVSSCLSISTWSLVSAPAREMRPAPRISWPAWGAVGTGEYGYLYL